MNLSPTLNPVFYFIVNIFLIEFLSYIENTNKKLLIYSLFLLFCSFVFKQLESGCVISTYQVHIFIEVLVIKCLLSYIFFYFFPVLFCLEIYNMVYDKAKSAFAGYAFE